MPPISLLIKPASGLCDLSCEYCFYCDVMKNRELESRGIMRCDTLEAVIEKALSFAEGTCTIGYQGGEPTLAGLDFFIRSVEIQRKYNTKNIIIENTIQTNGYAITEEWARFFAENDFLVGLSLDGIKKTNDAYRKTPNGGVTFERIMKTVSLFDRFEVQYNILTVLNRRTAENVRRIYEFYKKCNFKYLQFIPCLDPLSEEAGVRKYSLSPKLYGEALCELFDLWYADLLEDRHPYIRMFENYISILCGLQPESCDMRGVCGKQYVVEADGTVYPCDFYVLDEYCMGNLSVDDFPALDKRRGELRFVEQSVSLPEKCDACEYRPLCRSGCHRHRIHSEGQNYFCPSYRIFFAHALDRLRAVSDVIKEEMRF